ncbi:MAG: ferrochelatase [Bryobacteraceae bacterium]
MIYDAILVVSFGGPERREDVVPFLENVLRGKRVPRERLLEVAGHYYRLGGRSPLNDQVHALLAALESDLRGRGILLPFYWGNRNWHPMLDDTVARMRRDGVRRALAFLTSAWSSYSSCRQYLDNIDAARAALDDAPAIDVIPPFGLSPDFLAIQTDLIGQARDRIPGGKGPRAKILFTAHSIPLAMAGASRYESELREAAGRIAAGLGHHDWELVFQSRSGPPEQPWLEPDVGDAIRRSKVIRDLVIAPIGFLSDHMEVLYDLDIAAREVCRKQGVFMARAATASSHPRFASFTGGLIEAGLAGVRGCDPGCCSIPSRA